MLYSISAMTTYGHAAVYLDPHWQMLGAMEALNGAILLGLEVLVAADIIRTVAVTPTLTSVAVLGAIVVIRTFLSMSLQLEVEGRFPWQRTKAQQDG